MGNFTSGNRYKEAEAVINKYVNGATVFEGDLDRVPHFRCHFLKDGTRGTKCGNHAVPTEFDKTPVPVETGLAQILEHRLFCHGDFANHVEFIKVLSLFNDDSTKFDMRTRAAVTNALNDALGSFVITNFKSASNNVTIVVGMDQQKLDDDSIFAYACEIARVINSKFGLAPALATAMKEAADRIPYEEKSAQMFTKLMSDGLTEEVKELYRETKKLWYGAPIKETDDEMFDKMTRASKKTLQNSLDSFTQRTSQEQLELLRKISLVCAAL